MRILNRLAQRYLVRRTAPPAMIGIPGSDLIESTDWYLQAARSGGAYHIMAPTGAPLGVGEMPDVNAWRLERVGGGSDHHYIVDSDEPDRCLHAIGDTGKPGDLEVGVGQIRRGDWGAMWLLQEECVADARSIHLRYETPGNLSVFYTEVLPGEAPPGTYFCAYGFGVDARGRDPGGYVGIQQLTDGSRIVIFSVWHRLIDEERPVADALATAVAVHGGGYETPFGGEGSGTSIRLPLDWGGGGEQPVRFAVTAEPLGHDTALSAYLALGREPWMSLGSIIRAGTGGRLMSNPYSFIEDFARTGNISGVAPAERSPYRIRSALFGNPWCSVAPSSQDLIAVSHTRVTAYSPHPMEHLAADRAEPFGVYLATGTPSADGQPTIGATFQDASPHGRPVPRLDGVPY